jgi:hypothetical protein
VQRIAIHIFSISLLSPLAAHLWAGTYAAASCNQTAVNAVINGPTHTAVDGDVIQIPPGSCSWNSGISVPSGIGITIQGTGTPNSTPATKGASASCSNTAITVLGVTAFTMTPSYGKSTSRISCMALNYGTGASIAFSILGSCTASGCPNLRADNLTFNNWTGHASAGISGGITAVGNMFGVMDHNTVNGTPGSNVYLQLVEFSHASYLGVGLFGDNSWHLPENYGSSKFLFIEDNTFTNAGSTENEGSAGGFGDQGGGRVVVRFNNFASMDSVNFSMGWHGAESSGRPRSTRAYEYYGNTFTCASSCGQVAGARGGTGLVWGNASNTASGTLNAFFTLTTFRAAGAPSTDWGVCDGSSPWDGNDGTTYYTGAIASVSGSLGAYVVTVNGSPGWTTNQWSPYGAPYSIHDTTQGKGGEITASTSNTFTVNSDTSAGQSWSPAAGDSFQILRATWCLDQAAGRGTAATLYNPVDLATPAASANEALSPTYLWENTINGGNPGGVQGVSSQTLRVIPNRDFYVENINQAAQSSAAAPFNGDSGMGHGTLANRPTTCTTGVGYWATDQGAWNQSGSSVQGQLYLCTATNIWSLYYTPYAYPHPVTVGGGTISPPSSPPPSSPNPPTSLQSVVH